MPKQAYSAPSAEEAGGMDVPPPGEETGFAREPVSARGRGPFRASRSRPSARTRRRQRSCRSPPRTAGSPRRTSACTWAASRRRSRTIQQNPTPNLVIIESSLPRDHVLAELDRLAECCDPGHQGHRHRARQRRRPLSRPAEARRQRVPGRADRAAAADGGHLQPLQQSRDRAGRPRLCVHRRQGRRRLLDHLPQRGLGAVGDPQGRTSSSPTSILPSARRASISTRIPSRASPMRCRAPTASTRCCSTGC